MEIERIREKIANGSNFSDAEKYLVLLDDTANYVLKEGKFGSEKKTIHTMTHFFNLKEKLKNVNIPQSVQDKIAKVDSIGFESCKRFYQFHRNIGVVVLLLGIVCYFLFGFAISATIVIIGIIQIYVIVEYYQNAKKLFYY